MDIQKAKRLLAKINVLVDNHDEAYSTLENDLLKTYIKELYECVNDAGKSVNQVKRVTQEKVEVKPEIAEETSTQREVIVETVAETVTNEKTELEAEVEQTPEEPVANSEQPVPNELPVQEKAGDLSAEEKSPSEVPSQQTDKVIIETEVKKNGMHIPQANATEADPDIEALFALQKENDLLSKLGSKPVTLIENAMGINERIFTINELFRGDRELFQQTVDTINQSESYDQAKEFLVSGIASELGWSSENKAEKATIFIRLIQRKFSGV